MIGHQGRERDYNFHLKWLWVGRLYLGVLASKKYMYILKKYIIFIILTPKNLNILSLKKGFVLFTIIILTSHVTMFDSAAWITMITYYCLTIEIGSEKISSK
jgi:hypothetical protein